MPTVSRIKEISLVFVRRLLKDPVKYLGELHEEYGDICHIDKYGHNFYLCYSPKLAEHVLFSNQDNYSKIKNYKTYYPVFGKNSLFITNDLAQWEHDRKVAETVFDLKAHSADYVRVFSEESTTLVERIQGMVGNEAEPVSVPIADELNKLLFNIVQDTLFYDLNIDSDAMPELKDECHNVISEKSASLGLLWLLPSKKKRRYQYLVKYMKEARVKMLASRLNQNVDYDDLLGAFLKAYEVTDRGSANFQAVATQMITFNLVGQQEAVTTLLWAVIALAQHPEIAEKIASEVTSMCGDRFPAYDDLGKLKFSQAFISEVLRLHPPLFMVVRQCIFDDEVMGYRIPAKATVAVPLCRLHRHPDYWERPDDFIPDRFLAKPWGQDNEFAYMPFIVGKRNCIGRNFIFLAMALITGELSRRFRFSLPPAFKIEREQTYMVYDRPNLDTINVQPRRRGK